MQPVGEMTKKWDDISINKAAEVSELLLCEETTRLTALKGQLSLDRNIKKNN